jgi:hypothetical protein
VVRDHAADEVDIGIAGEADVHVAVHAIIGCPVGRDGGVFTGRGSARRPAVLMGSCGRGGTCLWGRRNLTPLTLSMGSMAVLLGRSLGCGGKQQ